MPDAKTIIVAESMDGLIHEITSARVLDDVQLKPYTEEFRATSGDSSAESFAKFLVHSGVLTQFQAERLLLGEGQRLALGPFLITDVLGTGSLGSVYLATGRSDRRRYAVKILPLRSLWNVHLAKKQVEIFAELPAHPALVPLIHIDTSGGSHYLVWPFAEGTLLDRFPRHRLNMADALRILSEIASGLAVCHAHGITHGLIKPSNIALGIDGQARLLDLGVGAILSENIDDDESMLDTISTANAAMSLLDCCAPETLIDPTIRTAAGDQYSMGCVLFYMLTGQLPFPDGNAVEKVLAHQSQPPPRASELNPAIPEWLSDLIDRLLSKNPEDRPSAEEMLAALSTGELPDAVAQAPLVAMPDDDPPQTLAGESLPVILTPSLRPPRPVQSKSVIDFDLPLEETSDPGFCLGQIPTPPEAATETQPKSQPRDPEERKHHSDYTTLSIPKSEAPQPITFTNPTITNNPTPAHATLVPPAPPPLPPFAKSWFGRLKAKILGRKRWEIVQISVFGPQSVAPGETISLQVFAHQPDSFESVCTLSRAFHQRGDLLATDYIQEPIRRDTEIKIHLAVANAGVGRALMVVRWLGQPQPRTFDVHVPWESPAGLTTGMLSAGIDTALVGSIPFQILILPRRG